MKNYYQHTYKHRYGPLLKRTIIFCVFLLFFGGFLIIRGACFLVSVSVLDLPKTCLLGVEIGFSLCIKMLLCLEYSVSRSIGMECNSRMLKMFDKR
jgi:hypothetical protein